MKELQRKQRIRRMLYSVPSLIVLLIITFFMARGVVRVVAKARESARQAMILEKKAVSLATREEELNKDIARLQTEDGVKDEIREKFSVTEAGEHVAIVVDDRRVSTSTDTSTWPWYKRLWNAIIGGE